MLIRPEVQRIRPDLNYEHKSAHLIQINSKSTSKLESDSESKWDSDLGLESKSVSEPELNQFKVQIQI